MFDAMAIHGDNVQPLCPSYSFASAAFSLVPCKWSGLGLGLVLACNWSGLGSRSRRGVPYFRHGSVTMTTESSTN